MLNSFPSNYRIRLERTKLRGMKRRICMCSKRRVVVQSTWTTCAWIQHWLEPNYFWIRVRSTKLEQTISRDDRSPHWLDCILIAFSLRGENEHALLCGIQARTNCAISFRFSKKNCHQAFKSSSNCDNRGGPNILSRQTSIIPYTRRPDWYLSTSPYITWTLTAKHPFRTARDIKMGFSFLSY